MEIGDHKHCSPLSDKRPSGRQPAGNRSLRKEGRKEVIVTTGEGAACRVRRGKRELWRHDDGLLSLSLSDFFRVKCSLCCPNPVYESSVPRIVGQILLGHDRICANDRNYSARYCVSVQMFPFGGKMQASQEDNLIHIFVANGLFSLFFGCKVKLWSHPPGTPIACSVAIR